jgi:NitT/TauT family transport system substrate-binding protein
MKRILALIIFGLLINPTAAPAQLKRIAVAYSAISATQAGFYLAKDAAIFEKYGLYVDPVYVAGASRVQQAMIAGEFTVALGGGNVVSVNLAGGNVVIIGGVVNVPSFYLFVQPSIKRQEDLKGKAIGISRFGTSIDTAARVAIQHYGFEPIKDVSIVQVGAVASAVGALRGGRIQAAILSYPTVVQARREGFREMLDIASLGMPYASSGITVRRSFMNQRKDPTLNYVKAIVEAIARVKRDKPFAVEVMGKYFRTKDKEMLEETYEIALTKYLKRVPYPTPEAFRNVLEELAQVNPKAKGQDPKRFYDDLILQDLDKSGFVSALYR